MTARFSLRTRDLALAGHISVQQVRNYEAGDLIPQAQRSLSGYRLYTRQHLAALHTVKSLVPGYGWPRTRAIMQALHRGDFSVALATIDERHAELTSNRRQMEQMLLAPRTLAAQSDALHSSQHSYPVREQHNRYRLYEEHQMRRLRVVARLRDAGYPRSVIQSVLDELAAGRLEKAIAAVEKRREELTRTSWLCIEALTSFQHYVSECGLQHSFVSR